GVPLLVDHKQTDVSGRIGTVTGAELVREPGGVAMRMIANVTEPDAIDRLMRGNLDRFSIGWHNTGDIICSECEAPLRRGLFGAYPTCDRMPGTEVIARDGSKRVVELVCTKAEGVEVSFVSVPAVVGTHIEGIRAELSAYTEGIAKAPAELARALVDERNA